MRCEVVPGVALDYSEAPRLYKEYFRTSFSRFGKDTGGCRRRIRVVVAPRSLIRSSMARSSSSVFLADDGVVFVDRMGAQYEIPYRRLGCEEIVIAVSPDSTPAAFYGYVLLGVLQVLLLRQGMTFVHSSGFRIGEESVLLPAWAGTGKTNALIEFLGRGGAMYGDDLCLLGTNGMLYPFPRPLNVYSYNCRWQRHLAASYLKRKWAWHAASSIVDGIGMVSQRCLATGSNVAAAVKRIGELSKSGLSVQMFPDEVPGSRGVASTAPVDAVIWLVAKTDDSSFGESALVPAELSRSIGLCLREELHPFVSAYNAYRYFGRGACLVPECEDVAGRSAIVAEQGVARAELVRIDVPIGVAPSRLAEEINQFLKARGRVSA